MQFSRTPLRKGATDLRWVRLKPSTRAKAHIEGERPCYVNSLLDLLPQLLLAPWRWLPPQLPRAAGDGAAAGITTISVMALASASSVAAMATAGALGPGRVARRSAIACAPSTSANIDRTRFSQ